jgi:hypothetical protein
VAVCQRSVPLDALRSALLRGDCLVIALVDKLTLSGDGGRMGSMPAGSAELAGTRAGQAPSAQLQQPLLAGASAGAAIAGAAAAAEAVGNEVAADSQAATDADEGSAPLSARAPSFETAAAAAGHGPYVGHYVVLCGYDGSNDEFEVRDPASHRRALLFVVSTEMAFVAAAARPQLLYIAH